MERKQVMAMFNKETRIGALATANKQGEVNAAVFGSPRMIDEDTVIMAIGDNRSYRNLQENPKASFIVVEPGQAPATWKGVRLYLEVDSMERYGELLDSFREKIRELAGDRSANAIVAAIRFKVTEVRPLIAPGG
ncbi:pyridoxamine 5'-phosphate oxidase [Desulfosarcina widdelii]|uniref:Pyridoxamine 5'-phosphate oxidase n=1 Tax=Desulfosarcina widdelii TaxID=947919 RepID=A0A5K7ZAR8_9BACT|nr:pyridoxamine 5'-phosphate oxidase family protein [Desulfosarcina widdelii]BBO78178.1 pyridoxamine 5'-phosphate oxidase [Desulfosarcina widdelii]